MCPACWQRVPKPLQNNVYRAWDRVQRGQGSKPYLDWLTARQKCLESLE